MVLEVNNTFDERRMYLLQPPRDEGAVVVSASPAKPRPLKATWPKDFHVSPFNSRDGSYSLVATDPAFPQTEGQGSVKNLITLRAGEGPVKLTASVFSERPSLDPASMTMLESLRFVALWWWVGLLTFPRIVGQAGRLFLKRRLGMRVYWRPEVKVKSIAREETPVERLAKDMLSRRRATADDTPGFSSASSRASSRTRSPASTSRSSSTTSQACATRMAGRHSARRRC